MKKTIGKAIATVVGFALAVTGFASTASAQTTDGMGVTQNSSTVVNADTLRKSLQLNERKFIENTNGYDIYAQKDAHGQTSLLAVPEGENPDDSEIQDGNGAQLRGFCAAALASAVVGVGSAVVGLGAAMGGLTIGGVFFSAKALGIIASLMGSYSAVENYIAQYVCR